MSNSTMKLKEIGVSFLIILIVYILPISLILAKVIPFEYKFHVLSIGTVALIVYSGIRRIHPSRLGFSKEQFKMAIKDVLPLTIGLSLIMIVLHFSGRITRVPNEDWTFYPYFILISAPSQEFLCRGFLSDLLRQVNIGLKGRILLSSLVYSFIHIIYLDIPTLIITFLIGLFWGMSYEKTKNIYGVIFSHAVLGAIAISIGLVN
jgi:uncharacterized protein